MTAAGIIISLAGGIVGLICIIRAAIDAARDGEGY